MTRLTLVVAYLIFAIQATAAAGGKPAEDRHMTVSFPGQKILDWGKYDSSLLSDAPVLASDLAKSNVSYIACIILSTAEAHSRQKGTSKPYLLYLQPGLKTLWGSTGLATTENALVPYIGPSTSTHDEAVTALLFEQLDDFAVPALYESAFLDMAQTPSKRNTFDLGDFVGDAGVGLQVGVVSFFVAGEKGGSGRSSTLSASDSTTITTSIAVPTSSVGNSVSIASPVGATDTACTETSTAADTPTATETDSTTSSVVAPPLSTNPATSGGSCNGTAVWNSSGTATSGFSWATGTMAARHLPRDYNAGLYWKQKRSLDVATGAASRLPAQSVLAFALFGAGAVAYAHLLV